jgi:hypothetical protein
MVGAHHADEHFFDRSSAMVPVVTSLPSWMMATRSQKGLHHLHEGY